MPGVQVILPAALTAPQPALALDCDADTVGQALRAAAAQAPRCAPRLFLNDRLLVSVVLNGRHLAPAAALATTLSAGDHVEVIPPVAGG
jgi:molybdopterin converting factor small subunit